MQRGSFAVTGKLGVWQGSATLQHWTEDLMDWTYCYLRAHWRVTMYAERQCASAASKVCQQVKFSRYACVRSQCERAEAVATVTR